MERKDNRSVQKRRNMRHDKYKKGYKPKPKPPVAPVAPVDEDDNDDSSDDGDPTRHRWSRRGAPPPQPNRYISEDEAPEDDESDESLTGKQKPPSRNLTKDKLGKMRDSTAASSKQNREKRLNSINDQKPTIKAAPFSAKCQDEDSANCTQEQPYTEPKIIEKVKTTEEELDELLELTASTTKLSLLSKKPEVKPASTPLNNNNNSTEADSSQEKETSKSDSVIEVKDDMQEWLDSILDD